MESNREVEDVDEIEKVADNRYAAVLLAAKWSRKLNSERKAKEELAEEATPQPPEPKVTSVALKDLKEGKIKFEKQIGEDNP
jgi:DNA-directed RNA polymerase omega subunit